MIFPGQAPRGLHTDDDEKDLSRAAAILKILRVLDVSEIATAINKK